MLFSAQRTVVFVILAVEVLTVVAQHQLVSIFQLYVALAEKHVLLAANGVGMNERQQYCSGRRRRRTNIRHIHYLRYIRALAIISEKEEGAILRNWATKASAELINLKFRAP